MNTHTPNGVVSSAMYAALAAHSLYAAVSFSSLYQEPADMGVNAQIDQANQFWRQQLGSAPVCTMAVREYLIECELGDWLRLFSDYVVPTIVALELPRPLPVCELFSVF